MTVAYLEVTVDDLSVSVVEPGQSQHADRPKQSGGRFGHLPRGHVDKRGDLVDTVEEQVQREPESFDRWKAD